MSSQIEARRRAGPLSALAAAILAFGVCAGAADEPSPEQIARKAAQTDKVADWSARVKIVNIDRNGDRRERSGTLANLLERNAVDTQRLYRFEAPADIAGTALLIHEHRAADDDIWLYLPAAAKVRRIVAGNKRNPFIGTQFAFADLVTQFAENFNHKKLGAENVDGAETVVIASTPRTAKFASDIGYSMQKAWIRTDNFVTVKVEYYGPRGELAKVQRLADLKPLDEHGNRWLALKRSMRNERTGDQTLIELSDLRVNQKLDRRLFSPNRLEDGR